MPGGVSRGKIDERFFAQCQELAAQADQQADATTTALPRPWQVGSKGTWSGDPLDVSGMTGAFDRSKIGTVMAEIYSGKDKPGTTGDACTMRLQNDYLAAMERAFRTAKAPLCRTELFAAGRRKGHGSTSGVLLDGVVRYAQDLLKAGQQ